uniref:Uncharacterized protein n=1 Tax=Glossina austeni TaxID=7395 RepID=A0A1A9UWI5_GLOAU
MLNLNCAIGTELFLPSDEAYVTISKTCAQCRTLSEAQSKRGKCDVVHGKQEGKVRQSCHFRDRATLAYGFGALPKLMEDIGDEDPDIQLKSIHSLAEMLLNPLHGQSAINAHEVVKRCQNFFLRRQFRYRATSSAEMDSILNVFVSIAMHMNGGQYILESKCLINQFYEIMERDETLSGKVAIILAFCTKEYDDVCFLQERYNAIGRLARIFGRDMCIRSHPPAIYRHMKWLLEVYPDVAVNEGLFEILFTRIKKRVQEFWENELECFALLLRCPEGQKRFVAVDGMKEMYDILNDTTRKLKSYKYVVFTIMHGLSSKDALWRSSQFVDLPELITNLAKDDAQLFCFQALYTLADVPRIKAYMRMNCYEDLKKLDCEDKINEERKAELLHKLDREIFHTSRLRVTDRKPFEIDMELRQAPFGTGRYVPLRHT